MSIIWTVGRLGDWYRTAIKLSPLTRIHIFWRGDKDEALHDHPNDFWTFPFFGYWEEWYNPETKIIETQFVKPWRWHFRAAEYRHRVLGRQRIVTLRPVTGRTWDIDHEYRGAFATLVRERPARRKWGFWVWDVSVGWRWVYWRDYLNVQKG